MCSLRFLGYQVQYRIPFDHRLLCISLSNSMAVSIKNSLCLNSETAVRMNVIDRTIQETNFWTCVSER